MQASRASSTFSESLPLLSPNPLERKMHGTEPNPPNQQHTKTRYKADKLRRRPKPESLQHSYPILKRERRTQPSCASSSWPARPRETTARRRWKAAREPPSWAPKCMRIARKPPSSLLASLSQILPNPGAHPKARRERWTGNESRAEWRCGWNAMN